MARTTLIASAAYIEPELEVEFGRIPPAFLPLGNRRLFQHQRAIVRETDRVIISLPESFQPTEHDQALIQELGMEILYVPDGLELGQSIVYVINLAAASNAQLSILHGDTLLRGLDLDAPDAVSVAANPPPGYRWGFASLEDERLCVKPKGQIGELALTGYFSFSSPSRLVQAVTRCGGNFLAGLAEYAQTKPVRAVQSSDWLDFGHAGTFYRSRRRVTTEREFNRLTATRRSFVKSGRNARKLEAEANWFKNIPAKMRMFTPSYLGSSRNGDEFSYELEYLYLPTLADLFVFGRLEPKSWEGIFAACDEFLETCASHPVPAPRTADLYGEKTLNRLQDYARADGIDLDKPCRFNGRALPSLSRMAEMAAAAIPAAGPSTLVHGDFCFSNILYDTRSGMVRVIDPRGLDGEGKLSLGGDIRYDIGKLYHSAIGLYDYIIAGNCRVARPGKSELELELPLMPAIQAIGQHFLETRLAGRTVQDSAAPAIACLLFFSMLPLHSDDQLRQDALLANGMRLFLDLDRTLG